MRYYSTTENPLLHVQTSFQDAPDGLPIVQEDVYVSTDFTGPVVGRSYEYALFLALHGVSSPTAVSAEVQHGTALPIGKTDIKLAQESDVLVLGTEGWSKNFGDGESVTAPLLWNSTPNKF